MSELPLGIDPRITSLITKLSELKSRDVEASEAFAFSNDEGVGKLIPSIKDRLQHSKVAQKAGLFVGHGSLWSLGKELPQLDLLIRMDMNSAQIVADREWANVIDQASGVEEILARLSERDRRLAEKEMISYGEYHYLASDEQLQRTQYLLRRRNIAFLNGNLLDGHFMTGIGDILRNKGTAIVFSDMSNAMEWMGGQRTQETQETAASRLALFPFADESVFLFGITMGKAGRAPIKADLVTGLDRYLRQSSRTPSLGEMLRQTREQ